MSQLLSCNPTPLLDVSSSVLLRTVPLSSEERAKLLYLCCVNRRRRRRECAFYSLIQKLF